MEKARAAHSAAEQKLAQLRGSADHAERMLSADGGPGGAFLAIADECFQTRVDQYTYEMCVFGGAKQDPGATSLGQWGGFDGEERGVFQFTGGTHCWNGPQRSLTVSAVCGAETQLSEVTEPNRCEYAARFSTPAACSQELLAEAQRALAAAEAEAAAAAHDELR